MRSCWQPNLVRRMSPLESLVYRSRLLGSEESLGLFGGGNTSLKCRQRDLLGRAQDVLWVKGSGADLKTCEARHFSPLPMAALRPLSSRRAMTDEAMVAFLERCLLDPKAPRPSIETLLHAFIPEAAVDHTHADAILSLANTRGGERLIRRVLGPQLLWIPYLQPGFALSRRVAAAYQRQPDAHGAVLEHHGLITWGPDGRTSYERTLSLVTRAERFIAQRHRRRSWSPAAHASLPADARTAALRRWAPAIRRSLSRARKVCLTLTDAPDVLAFVNARRMPTLARTGPATPDHMLRTKRLPLVVRLGARPADAVPAAAVIRQLERYAADHERYVRRFRRSATIQPQPFPRVILIPGVGMLTSGKDATETGMVAQLYRHAMAVMRNAAAIGQYTSVSAREAFGVEYWPLELYKLTLAPPEEELSRAIGLVTGAAGGIGRAIARQLIDRGACVAVTDLDRGRVEMLAEELNRRAGRARALGLAMDVTDERSVERAFDALLRAFGGLDFLVSNAGIAHVAGVERLRLADWERSLSVNATGHFLVGRAAVRLLRAQGMGGSLVFIASKNVLAPGKEFGAYSAAKAAQVQLARVLAIENGEFGIRVNVVNPDGVFDGSGLWQAIGRSRAKTYRIRPGRLAAYYQRRNLLQARILPEDVAEAVGFFVSGRSAKTTGCILTVDGGLREAFPR
ncbi:MAG: bifunctional rhamnulose-1-phosphate aldolase/short-chain dehydrogenase [Candidatus Omnitrophica bacterium]|nr:bifunctional rhamnulose-1-phosphate aldolase/short-chain dehydrogenase [Candidatus Omnitrophota bacterium]